MIGLGLSCRYAVMNLAFLPCVEPDAAVAVAIGLAHAERPPAVAPANDPSRAGAAAAKPRPSAKPSWPSAGKPAVATPPECDEHGCPSPMRNGMPRRWFGIRR